MTGAIDFEHGCKYCGGPVSPGYYCCRSCWNDYEEERPDDYDDYEEDEEDYEEEDEE